jgi:hypothetical protein
MLITGLTWSSSITMSPMTIVSPPAFLNDAQEVRPNGGVSLTPPAVMARSARGTETLNTPGSLASGFPFAPVSRSMRAVSSVGSAPLDEAAGAAATTSAAMSALFIFDPYLYLAVVSCPDSSLHHDSQEARGCDDQWLGDAPEA